MSELYSGPIHQPKGPVASNEKNAVAISAWTGDRAIAIGNQAREEWITFDGEVVEVSRKR